MSLHEGLTDNPTVALSARSDEAPFPPPPYPVAPPVRPVSADAVPADFVPPAGHTGAIPLAAVDIADRYATDRYATDRYEPNPYASNGHVPTGAPAANGHGPAPDAGGPPGDGKGGGGKGGGGRPPGPPPAKPLLALLLVPIIAAFALWAFAWPAVHASPHGLPVGVAGSPGAITQVEARLAGTNDAFEVHRYLDESAARQAVQDREVYGAVVAGPRGTTVFTAPAASPVVANLLDQTFGAHAQPLAGKDSAGQANGDKAATGRTVQVVPLPTADPRGAGLTAAVLPLVLAGIIAGVLTTLFTRPGAIRISVLIGGAALVGLVGVGILQGWLEVLDGNAAANATVLGLTVLAISGTLTGLASLIGPAGIGMTAFLMAFLGNPFSGITSAPEMLPEPVGTIGQLLPPGAGGALLRSTAYFDGNAAGGHIAVLAAWIVIGGVLLALSTVRAKKKAAAMAAAAAAT
ncbi:hypothetical protein RCO28_26450 [Streptomyces sp. LHD-70]|uniref:hypothetical protein n=1 Tax=Streptomyces sp. LHD-70 TaxID=3072140 RepID=UPI00280DBE36|nr:hypothetical protein [Streptomyces sp. LHD-70]MDQ8705996.1 hypothetical protein [Streptomyces sp. LHD-70]